MKKKDPNEYDDNNPWEGDKLDRESVGIYLTDLVSSIEQPFVIALKSEFGTGKTDFLQRWQRHLNKSEEQAFKAVYFNSWETDYASEPLVALISKIIPQITSQQPELLDALDSMVMHMLAASISGAVDFIDSSGAIKKIVQTGKDIVHSGSQEKRDEKKYGIFKRRIEEFEATEKAINEFRSALSSYLKNQNKSKLVILIDELDRCRPTYAIEVLECIKHLFNIPGIIFVIAVDSDQLQNAVSSVYGSKLDGDGYLRKFFDWQLNLPKPSAKQYTRYLIKKFDLLKYFKSNPILSKYLYADFNSLEAFIEVFSIFSEVCSLSLRKQEQSFTTLELILRTKKEHEPVISSYLGLLLVVHTYLSNADAFKRFCFNTRKTDDDPFHIPTSDKSAFIFSNPENLSNIKKNFDDKGIKYKAFLDFLFKDLSEIINIIGTTREELDGQHKVGMRNHLEYKIFLLEKITDVIKNEEGQKKTTLGQYLYKKIEKASDLLDDQQK